MFTFTTDPVALPEGNHTLTICAEEVLLNRVDSFAYAAVEPLNIDFTDNALRDRFITLGNFMMKPTEGILRIAGNKSGFALFGKEGYTDMVLDVRFRIPEKGSGASGILLHATDVSLYDAQVAESWFGYSLTVSRLGVTLKRARYGATGSSSFEAVAAWKTAEEGELHIEMKDGKLSVYLPGESEPILTAEDAKPFTHGLWGFFSTGKELSVLECTVTPLQ